MVSIMISSIFSLNNNYNISVSIRYRDKTFIGSLDIYNNLNQKIFHTLFDYDFIYRFFSIVYYIGYVTDTLEDYYHITIYHDHLKEYRLYIVIDEDWNDEILLQIIEINFVTKQEFVKLSIEMDNIRFFEEFTKYISDCIRNSNYENTDIEFLLDNFFLCQ